MGGANDFKNVSAVDKVVSDTGQFLPKNFTNAIRSPKHSRIVSNTPTTSFSQDHSINLSRIPGINLSNNNLERSRNFENIFKKRQKSKMNELSRLLAGASAAENIT